MIKRIQGLLLVLVAIALWSFSDRQPPVLEGFGELYVLYNDDNSVRILLAGKDGSVTDSTFARLPANLRLRYTAAGKNTDVSFDFPLHKRIKHPFRQEKPEKTIVISDLHGRLDAFVGFLKGNGVVDDKLNWIYGTNQLVMIGDFLDRGRDDCGIGWLIYKLEKEAENAGGRVDYIYGNHEDLVLKDDLRYTHEAHFAFTAKAGIPYAELYGPNTEMGRWIRDSYMIITVGNNLFVHGGLGAEFLEKSYKIGEINELGWRFFGLPTKVKKELHPRNDMLFGNSGPLWYRGLVFDTEKHPPISSKELDRVLHYYQADRILVGHSEVDEIDWRYDGRVIAVNVKHSVNFKKDHTAGVLIEGDNIYSVTYSGVKVKLNEPQSPLVAEVQLN